MRRTVFVALAAIGAGMGCGGLEEDTAIVQDGAPAADRSGSGTSGNYFWTWWTDNDDTKLVTFTSTGNKTYTSNWDFRYVDCTKYPAGKCPRDFVGGKGWKSGSGKTVNYYASWSNSYGGCLGIYGWSNSPNVEYYICDATGALEGPHTSADETEITYKGTVFSDGGIYDIYHNWRRDKPSIFGNPSTFEQYISIRRTPKTSGSITVQTHFDAWKNLGMSLGNLNWTSGSQSTYEDLATEGWKGNGNSSVTLDPTGLKITVTSQYPADVHNAARTASCSVGNDWLTSSTKASQTCTWPLPVNQQVTLEGSCGSPNKWPPIIWSGCDSTTYTTCTLNVKSTSAVSFSCG